MRVEVLDEKVFVPEWNGNNELPEDEQIKVIHRFLKPGEREKFLYMKPIKFHVGDEVNDKEMEYVQDSSGMTKALVKRIENLTLVVNGKEKVIDTAAKLYDTEGVPQMLVTEIEVYMLNASPEVDKDFL